MKKLVIALGVFFAAMLVSCVGCTEQTGQQTDTIAPVEQTDSLVEVTGVAIDGAMNSVYLKVGDDTVEFSYPDLESEHRASWSINDTLTVRYYETQDGDSVTDVINHTDA